MAPQEAFHLVSENVGIAMLTEQSARSCEAEGVAIRPFAHESLWFETCVVSERTTLRG